MSSSESDNKKDDNTTLATQDTASDSKANADADDNLVDQAPVADSKTIDTPSDETTDETVSNQKPVSKKSVPASAETKQPRKKRSFVLWLFILLLLGTAGAGYYFWLQLQTQFKSFDSQLTYHQNSLDSVLPQLDQARADIQKQQALIQQLTTDNQTFQKQIEEFYATQQTVVKSMQNVFDITHRNQRQWLLAEVSYLLSLGNQRLIVSRDATSAIAALKAANHRLADLSDPSLLKLRQQIAAEIAQLNLLKQPDINGIAFTLDNMLSLIHVLPFKSAQQKTKEAAANSETIELGSLQQDSYFAAVWERIKKLVTIKRHSREIKASETLPEKSDIDNQVRFRIEAARLALINKNTDVFNYEMRTTSEMVKLYYDATDSRVTELMKELSTFSQIILVPALPDISQSWQQLQKIIAVKDANDSVDGTKKNNKGTAIQ